MLLEEQRLKVYENEVLRRISQPVRDKKRGGWKNCIMKSSIICTLYQILLGQSNQGG
jgi:hypothetical protein